MFSQYTSYLANRLCGGSSRKLIAGWWYSILALTGGFLVVAVHDGLSLYAALLLVGYGIGGTMILRKFHSSLAVGFFMGVTVAAAPLFVLLSLLYFARGDGDPYVTWRAAMALVQGVLLGSFAAILAAHRTEILLEDTPPTTEAAEESDAA